MAVPRIQVLCHRTRVFEASAAAIRVNGRTYSLPQTDEPQIRFVCCRVCSTVYAWRAGEDEPYAVVPVRKDG